MSPLLGSHSTNPGGSQGLYASLQQLKARADAGDAQALATLRTIAAGGTTSGSSVPGWNETINWGAADTGHGNTGGRANDRALAQAVLAGNTQRIGEIESNKAATHKDWTGGTLASLAPAAVGLIPGIGMPLAAGIGAGIGALASRDVAGLTNTSALGGAAQGAGTAVAARGIARTLAPGTFAGTPPAAPSLNLSGAGDAAVGDANASLGIGPSSAARLPSVAPVDVPISSVNGWTPMESANIAANSATPAVPGASSIGSTASTMPSLTNVANAAQTFTKPKPSVLSGIGRFLTSQPTTIPSILGAGASMYGAYQTGKAEDRRAALEEQAVQQSMDMRNRRVGFDTWRRRRAPGSPPTA